MRKMSLISCLILAPVVSTPVAAGSLMSGHFDLALEGGLAGGYFYSTNTGSTNFDNYLLSDGLIELAAANPVAEMGNGYIGFGNLKMISILDGNGDRALGYEPNYYENVNTPIGQSTLSTSSVLRTSVNRRLQNATGIYYGYAEIKPFDGLSLDMGLLRTHIGYENAATFKNKNVLLGALWRSQPNFYSGVRANVEIISKNKLYLEMNDDVNMDGTAAWGAGFVGEYDIANYKFGYFDSRGGRNVFDLAGGVKLPYVSLGLDINIQTGDKAYWNKNPIPLGTGTSAWGLAMYVVPEVGPFVLPLRFEYMSDRTTGLYRIDYVQDQLAASQTTAVSTIKQYGINFNNYDSLYSITFSPTFNVSDSAFLRLELAYVSAKNFIFKDKNNITKFDKFSTVLQGGYRF